MVFSLALTKDRTHWRCGASNESKSSPDMMLLPSSAERFVELHDRQLLRQPNPRQVERRLKQVTIGVQRIQLGVDSPAIAQVCQPQAVLKRSDQRCLFFTALPHALVRNQSVG